MSALSDKYYSKQELINIAKAKNINEGYFDMFIWKIEKDIQEMTGDNGFDQNDISDAAVDFAVTYIDKFNKELQKGHSKEWAKLYAENSDEHEIAFSDAYESIKKMNPEEAIEELKIHCTAMGGDELYTKYFIFLMETGEALNDPDRQAAIYSDVYKVSIAKGKSVVFAHKYADLMASEEDTELGCFSEAEEYNNAIEAGRSERFASAYAYEISEIIANHYYSYEEAIGDEYYKMEKERIEQSLKYL